MFHDFQTFNDFLMRLTMDIEINFIVTENEDFDAISKS